MIRKPTPHEQIRLAIQSAVEVAAPDAVRQHAIAALRTHAKTVGLPEDVLVREVDGALAEAKLVGEKHMPEILARRLVTALAGARTRVRVVELAGSKAFSWLPAPRTTHAETSGGRFSDAFALTAEALAGALTPSASTAPAPALPAGTERWFAYRRTLPESLAEEAAVRMRVVNAVVFSPVTRDMARAVRELAVAPASALANAPRAWQPPHVLSAGKADSKFEDIFSRALQSTTLTDGSGRATVTRAPLAVQTGPSADAWPQAIDSMFYASVPVGAYGVPLAKAIVEAIRVACAAITPLAQALEKNPAWYAVGGTLTFNHRLPGMLHEGIVSVGQALGLILGQRSDPAMEVDELLARIGSDGLLVRMAAEAPFGVIAPLAGSSFVASDPLTVGPNGRLRLPEGLHTTFKQTLASRFNPNAQDKAAPNENTQTQTLRGCPVAMRAPEVLPDGKVEIAPHSALHELSVAFIDLVRRIYAADMADALSTSGGA